MIPMLLGATLIATLTAASGGTALGAASVEETARTCAACHTGALSFADRDVDQLAARIRQVAAGAVPHPPIAVDADAVDALAEALARPAD